MKDSKAWELMDAGFKGALAMRAPMENGTVILRRTFNQYMPLELALELDPAHCRRELLAGRRPSVRYWRIIGPLTHKCLESDLSLEGLKVWGVLA